MREELAPDYGETKKDGQVFQNTFTATLGDMVFRLKLVVQDARSMEKARELTGSETYCSVWSVSDQEKLSEFLQSRRS